MDARAHTASDVQGVSSRPSKDDEKPSLNFDDDVDEEFALQDCSLVAAKGFFTQQRQVHDDCGQLRVGPPDRRGADSKTAGKHKGLQEAKGAENHRDQRKQEGIRNSNRHQLGIHHRLGWQACSCSHLGHVRTWTKTQCLLLHQSNAIRGSAILETGNPHLHFDSSTSLPLIQHPEDKGVCSCDVFLRTLGSTTDASSTPAVVSAAQASNGANRGNCTFKQIDEFCDNFGIAMEHATTVTPQRQRVSARYGQNISTQKECSPTGGNNIPKEATVPETERQHSQIPDITPEEAILTETERFCALVQVMLHYYANNLLEEEKSPTTTGASSTGAGASSSEEEASSSPEIGESSSRAGALPQKVGVSFVRSYTCYFARGRTFYNGWGRTGCTASRDRQYKTQSESRGYLRQRARDRSIRDKPPDRLCGVRLRRERPVSDLGGGKQGD